MRMRAQVFMCVCMCGFVNARASVCMSVCVRLRVHAQVCMCVCIRACVFAAVPCCYCGYGGVVAVVVPSSLPMMIQARGCCMFVAPHGPNTTAFMRQQRKRPVRTLLRLWHAHVHANCGFAPPYLS